MFSIDKYERVIKSKQGVLFVKGRPGSAKSAIIKKIANNNDWQFFDIRLAQIDSSEILGIPHIKKIGDVNVMSYAVPEWAVRSNEKPTLIFFDELNRAPIDVRNAALQILLDRKIGLFEFNDNVYMASAGNLGDADGTEVEELDKALKTRLVPITHDLTLDEWIKNFAKSNVNPYIVSFLQANPSYLFRDGGIDKGGAGGQISNGNADEETYANPRTWTFLSNFVGKDSQPKEMLELVREYGVHYIGTSASKLSKYLEDMNIVTIKDILNNYSKVQTIVRNFKRDKISEFVNELKKMCKDIEKWNDNQVSNIVMFLKDVDPDEAAPFFFHISSLVDVDNKDFKSTNVWKIALQFKELLTGIEDTVE